MPTKSRADSSRATVNSVTPALTENEVGAWAEREQSQMLLESEQRSRALVEHARVCIHEIDTSGRLLSMNPAGLKMMGASDESEVLGLDYLSVVAPEDRANVAALLARAYEGHASEFEFKGISKTGPRAFASSFIPLSDSNGKVTKLMGVTQDITEQKRAEEELESFNETLAEGVEQRTQALHAMANELRQNVKNTRLIVDTANEAFVTMDANGLITDWNPQAEATFGWSRTEAMGRKVAETIIPPQYRKAHQKGLDRFLASGEGRVLNKRLELTALHRDGHQFPVELAIAPVQHNGSLIFHAFLHDITQRKRAEEELRLGAVAFETHECIFVTDKDGTILRVNKRFTDLYGYTADEAVGRNTRMLKSGRHDQEFYPRIWAAISDLGFWEGEIWNRRKNGEVFPQRLTITAVRNESGETTHYIGVAQDITERKRGEEALAELASGVALPRRSADDTKTLIRLNDITLKDLNLCGAAIRGMSVQSHEKEELAERVTRFFYERLVDEQGQRALALVRCFETRAYEELDEELKAIVSTSLAEPAPGMKCLTLVATAGEQEQWNDIRRSVGHRVIPLPSEAAVKRLPMISQLICELGLEVGGVVNRHPSILVDATASSVFHVAEAKGSPYIPAQDEFVIPFGIRSVVGFGDVLPSGNLFVVIMFSKIPISREAALLFSHVSMSVSIALLKFAEIDNKIEAQLTAIDRLVKNQEDIVARQESQLRAALETLSHSNDEFQRSNEDLQHFVYGASHDLQEPLRAIAGFCQLLQRQYKGRLDRQAEEWIEHAVEGAGRMRALIEDLLIYSRVDTQAVAFRPTDCSAVFDEAVAILRSSIDESEAAITRDPLPTVVGNRSQLLQVMQNLIGNGIKFQGDRTPRVHVSAESNGEEWTLAVGDNGLGIPANKLESIFEVFCRLHTQQAYPGTGIGLAICRRIVERHGGKIWVESELRKGSTFFVTLPAVTSNPAA